MPDRNSFDGSDYCESDQETEMNSDYCESEQGIEMNPWEQPDQTTSPCPRESESLDHGTEPLVTAQGVAITSERQVSSVLSLSAFLSQADSLKVSIKALDTLKLQAGALHERIDNVDFLEDLAKPAEDQEPDTDNATAHVLAHSTQQATLIDLAYQASALISSIYTQLLTLQADLEATPKERDFKAKKSAFQSLMPLFKCSLLSYTSEQCNCKFLLKKQIRKEYLSLRRDASEAEVNKAVEDKTDWGMGLVRRDPVASFVERLGLGDSTSAVGDNEFYGVNGGWEDTTSEVKDVLDRVAGLRGEVKRVEGIIKELRGLYREIEGLGNIAKRDRLASRTRSPALSVGNGMLQGGERQMGMDKKDVEVLCCGLLGRDALRGWTGRMLTAVGRTGVGALALFDGFMMGVRREWVRRGHS